MFTYSEDIFSDFHKDTYGFRPRNHEFYDATPERKQEIWDAISKDFELNQEWERLAEQKNISEFNRAVETFIEFGAQDRSDALRWMTQNKKFYNQQCVEHWVWDLGILFTDEGRALVKELMEIVQFNKVADEIEGVEA